MEWAWAWANGVLLVVLLVLPVAERVDRPRLRMAVRQVLAREMGATLQGLAVLATGGAAAIAIGLVTSRHDDTLVYGGFVVVGLAALLAVVVLAVGVIDRYQELGYRHRLTTLASRGRVFLDRLRGSGGSDFPRSEIDGWAAETRELLDEMDPPGVYRQRFDINAGLSPTWASGHGIPAQYETALTNWLTRLSEIMRESQR